MNMQPSIIQVIQILGKLKSHIHCYLASFIGHLISFTHRLFNNHFLIKFIWLWILIYLLVLRAKEQTYDNSSINEFCCTFLLWLLSYMVPTRLLYTSIHHLIRWCKCTFLACSARGMMIGSAVFLFFFLAQPLYINIYMKRLTKMSDYWHQLYTHLEKNFLSFI